MEIKRVAVVGAGGIGRMMIPRLQKIGLEVSVFDTDNDKTVAALKDFDASRFHERSKSPDLMIYAIPPQSFLDKSYLEIAARMPQPKIVSGQTSVKMFERDMLTKAYPGIPYVPIHSMHAPSVDPKGRNLVVIQDDKFGADDYVADVMQRALESKISSLASVEDHDRITAVKQALVHHPFITMADTWREAGFFPWGDSAPYEDIKQSTAFRILSGSPDTYGPIALLNPFAKTAIRTYATASNDLLANAIGATSASEREENLKQIIHPLRSIYAQAEKRINLADRLSMFKDADSATGTGNSNLSQLALAVTLDDLGVNPYDNASLNTPPYELFLGITEHVMSSDELLQDSLNALVRDPNNAWPEDIRFARIAGEWATLAEAGKLASYNDRFDDLRDYHSSGIDNALEAGSKRSSETLAELMKTAA